MALEPVPWGGMPKSHPNGHGSYLASQDDLLRRLRRIEGQIRGVQRMVEDDAYCVDVLTQISAVVSACEKVGLKVLESHIRGCVADAIASDDGDSKITELTEALERFLKVGKSPVS